MKILRGLVVTLGLFLLCSCYTSKSVSMFSSDQVVLGMNRADFLNIYGQPFSKDQRYVNGRRLEERLLYKEELYKGSWFIVTTAFTFVDGKLVRQATVKEERKFLNQGDKENEKK